MDKLKLSKKIEINGELKTEIEYDLENLTGDAIENTVKSLQKSGYVPAVQEIDTMMQAYLFAEAAGLDYMDIKRLSAKDFLRATGKVRDFFLSDVEDSPQENTSEQ